MSERWLRNISAQIDTVTIESGTLDIDFTVESSSGNSEKAMTTIIVWNMAPQTLAAIQTGHKVTLTAGYEGDNGIIFTGRVLDAVSKRSGADTYVEITCADYTLPKNVQPRVWEKGTRIATILEKFFSDAGLIPGEIINDLGITTSEPITTDPDGKTTLTTLLELINSDPETKKSEGLSVSFMLNGGTACVIATNQHMSTTHYVSPATGLMETNVETNDDYERTATVLLDWKIQTSSLIELQTTSDNGSGTYSVVGYAHKCDGDTYSTTLKLKAITQEGEG